ncbi:MAG: response regulator [Caldithrix sp.]|nr:response regulator [Caldithrix sp.]
MMKRVLIVDDEETLTFSLYQSFIRSEQDFEVITANSGEEALDKAEGKKLDLVITDIFMPGIDGFQLIKQLKNITPNTGFFVITAYGNDEYRDKADRFGALEYIEKPFDIKAFRQKVLDYLA